MKIEVGEYYLSANCNMVKIIKHNPNIGIFVSNIDVLHKSDGTVNNGFDREYDLIAHIPKQLLNYIVFVTELYHTNNDMKQMVDNNYGFNSNKFEATNEMLKLATEQIDRLNKAIHIKDITIASLEIKEKELSDKIYSLCDKAEKQTKLSNDNYQAWIEEHETNRKLSIGLTVMTVGWVGVFVMLIGVLLK